MEQKDTTQLGLRVPFSVISKSTQMRLINIVFIVHRNSVIKI